MNSAATLVVVSTEGMHTENSPGKGMGRMLEARCALADLKADSNRKEKKFAHARKYFGLSVPPKI